MSSNLMAKGTLLSRHYHETVNSNDTVDPAQVAFERGVRIFKETLTKDPNKQDIADQLLSFKLEDVIETVTHASSHYQERRASSTIRELLASFSKRLLYYGNIVDVLVQHHPEYVSLVWGAMKIVFGAVVEHERTGTTIVEALSEIADSLPRVQLAMLVYQTEAMQREVSMLYALIVRFLIRAWDYLAESRLSRALHAVTRPSALRYDDILKAIQQRMHTVASQAIVSSQAELRDMHLEMRGMRDDLDKVSTQAQEAQLELQNRIDGLVALVLQLQETVVTSNAATSAAQLQVHSMVSEIQLTQALTTISSQCSIDHKTVFQTTMQLKSRYQIRGSSSYKHAPLWSSPKLQEWNKEQSSSAILLKSTFRDRLQIRGFCTDVIEQLLKSRIAVLWVLADKGRAYSLLEVLKSLVVQTLGIDYSSHFENRMNFQLGQFHDAHFEEDYLNILAGLLQHFKLVYIVANAEAMAPSTAVHCRESLRQLSHLLSERNHETVLKVITTAYGPGSQSQNTPESNVLTMGKMSKRQAKRQMRAHSRKYGR